MPCRKETEKLPGLSFYITHTHKHTHAIGVNTTRTFRVISQAHTNKTHRQAHTVLLVYLAKSSCSKSVTFILHISQLFPSAAENSSRQRKPSPLIIASSFSKVSPPYPAQQLHTLPGYLRQFECCFTQKQKLNKKNNQVFSSRLNII